MKEKSWTVICVLTAAALLWGMGQTPAQAAEAAPRNIKAQDFMNTFGVNIHFGDNNYRNIQAIADALNIIGFSRVRISCTGRHGYRHVRKNWRPRRPPTSPRAQGGCPDHRLPERARMTLASQQTLDPADRGPD